ncbi:aspartyl-phosphate phosphatase Spo0E family protein [Cohnella silvisoli]|uniref:Aspartyl-phosphate phosphatase Spo0E family protein n=1 Tax=Cohnella silvisoli TaxID=2873699 RepID=A0ABV1KVG4_9BACL|nr:aspartyl-phosphate phosphatase Spo0E family protein [Cohnella silvisoli]MCD9023498.1 aspartyl-phosphate phosphatase Spo0E family protein [Cohnella silvisoli]
MKKELLRHVEVEKAKLNELGQKSLEQGIPLGENETVQTQSRRVDELVIQFHRFGAVEQG